MAVKSDIEIAQEAKLLNIKDGISRLRSIAFFDRKALGGLQ